MVEDCIFEYCQSENTDYREFSIYFYLIQPVNIITC